MLLVVLDTVRADHLPFHGYRRDTAPAVTALAERGVVFERAISTAPWTVPAHATLFTGRYGHELQPRGRLWKLPDGPTTLAEIFAARGYATGGFVGNVLYCNEARGVARGFGYYEDYHPSPAIASLITSVGRMLVSDDHRPQIRNDAATVTDGFLAWLSRHEDRPFFAFLNYFDAHALYLPPPPYDEMFGPRSEHLRDWRSRDRHWTDAQMQGFERAYDGCIRYVDHHLGRIVEHLEEAGELDETVVVVTSDHGEHFGEHGLLSHANSLYRPLLHVPMVICFPPAVPAPRRVAETVSLRDLAATVLDLAGIEPRQPFPGRSLQPLWRGGASAAGFDGSPAFAALGLAPGQPSWWPTAKGDMRSLTVGSMHFILNGDGRRELYDLDRDPGEARNLARTREGAELAEELHRRTVTAASPQRQREQPARSGMPAGR